MQLTQINHDSKQIYMHHLADCNFTQSRTQNLVKQIHKKICCSPSFHYLNFGLWAYMIYCLYHCIGEFEYACHHLVVIYHAEFSANGRDIDNATYADLYIVLMA